MHNFFIELIFVIWFFLPAGIANTVPVIAAKVPLLSKYKYPVDCFKKFKGKRILGDHKTIRGFLTGIFSAVLIVYFQQYLYLKISFIREYSFLNYLNLNPLLLGFLLGFGGLIGDSIKSFFKRQLDVKPGQSWIPFDQIDYIIGGIIFTYLYIPLSLSQYLILFIFWSILHPVSTIIGYAFGLKEKPI